MGAGYRLMIERGAYERVSVREAASMQEVRGGCVVGMMGQ